MFPFLGIFGMPFLRGNSWSFSSLNALSFFESGPGAVPGTNSLARFPGTGIEGVASDDEGVAEAGWGFFCGGGANFGINSAAGAGFAIGGGARSVLLLDDDGSGSDAPLIERQHVLRSSKSSDFNSVASFAVSFT